ncbi:MAG: outer membrane protein assembly factor BamA [Gammaproteobacteria bacterium]|nr:outer membrane protein assembly factor BamA [Gammaproteobacteria bacterium]
MKLNYLVFLCLFLFSGFVGADESFVVKDIKVEGLQRISLGAVLSYLPFKVGESMSQEKIVDSVRALYKAGFFDDVKVGRENDIVVIRIKERPSIDKLEIFGNVEISTDTIKDALKEIGLAEGRVLNRSALDRIHQELKRQYFGLSYYGVDIKSSLTDLPRNRVDLQIDITENDPGRVRKIKLIGAKAFNEFDLMNNFEMTQGTLWSFMTGSDKYADHTLEGDLERLKSYYMDRGYINFRIESKNVSISPDKKNIYVTIKINEGEQFHAGEIKLAGDLVIPEGELRGLLQLKQGDVFSRFKLIQSVNNIKDRLGIDGYAFANVNEIPDFDQKKKEIAITFFVDPGKRVYVRRINIGGNTKTHDEVIRRELRQMEGGWISTPLLKRSQVRLQRLGFFDDIKITTPAVPGTTDQVDVNIDVVEGSTGNFTAGIGYGQENGFLFNTSITLNNYLGTGKKVKLQVDNNKSDEIYNFSIDDPYFTKDGVSRGMRLSYRSRENAELNLADFSTDELDLGMNFGIPVSEYTRASFGMGGKRTDLTINQNSAPQSYINWVNKIDPNPEVVDSNNIKTDFTSLNAHLSYSYDSRNRPLFPDEGLLSRFSGEATLPWADLKYYKLNYRLHWYVPLYDYVTLLVGGEYGVGYGYGDKKDGADILPFFENFFAGGSRSVRGFRGNTIGPKDMNCDPVCEPGDPVGGNERTLAKLELFFPPPFTDEPSKNFRLSAFVDAGRIRSRAEDTSDIFIDDRYRVSYGFAAVWVTPVGALIFNWAWPINSYDGDQMERFQFNIGAPF